MLIDLTRLASRLLEGKRPTGVDRVSLAYLEHFGPGAEALVRHWGRWVPLGVASGGAFAALLGQAPRPAARVRTAVATSYALRWSMRRGAVLLNTGHSGLDDPAYAEQVRRYGLRPVYFLHDLIPITHPEYCRPGEADKHARRLRTMLSTGVGLILNSEATAADLRAWASAQGMALPPTVVAPIGTVLLPGACATPPLAEPYFVMLGTVEPRKNHLLLLHLWRQMADGGGGAIPKLVVIGQRGWECEQVIDLLERCQALRGHVVELRDCDDTALSTWLAHARALLFPSFVEGYGMPLAEALGHGLPVIASNLAVFREIAGAIPDYLDPLDGPGWWRAVLDYAAAGSAARAAQLERMRGGRAPTWDDHFCMVENFLASIPGGAA
ncbi:glycosyl transferases group 1 [mine drainage metagenome]|jgi:glycosyltransferase involved in cell wall biosynthesis|uniref:Glycosyl transferases group 1 n=1 Tax=mine drainage metagenome TaxID=410659 RepID=A0A1J5QSU4_9ZZZZ